MLRVGYLSGHSALCTSLSTQSRAEGHFGSLSAVWSPDNDLWENGLMCVFPPGLKWKSHTTNSVYQEHKSGTASLVEAISCIQKKYESASHYKV